MPNKKVLIAIIVFLSTIIIASWLFYWISKYIDYKKEKIVLEINNTLKQKQSKETCEKILNFDMDSDVYNNNKFKKQDFSVYRKNCDEKFNINNINLNLENCKEIIKSSKNNLKNKYIILDEFDKIQKLCSDKYLSIKFWTWSFFDVNNDFKSNINIDFSMPFFKDIWELASQEYMNNRIDAKKRLIKLLEIKPNVKINIDDIVLYPKKGILKLNLQPLTEYQISLKSFNNEVTKLKSKKEILKFKTPENKFLWISIKNPVSLYMDKNPPEFEVIKYNLENKKETNLKICRISNENYAKIEIIRWRKELLKEKKEFFLDWIDKLKTFECFYKNINLSAPLPLEETEWGKLLIRKTIDFSEEIWTPARSWLYFVTFANKEDRNINNNLQNPIFFWIIDSHITMKISKNWESFFFVNDFEWKPLEKQKIRIYVNKFREKERKWNREIRKSETTYFSPLDKLVLWKEIVLWETNSEWILKVNLKGKVDNAFNKTFNNEWNYEYNWINDSFFVTSASDNNLTYNHSQWNAWIAPWNFGYKINSSWWNNDSGDKSTPKLNRWVWEEKEFYSHIYTDRVLYLPGEEVNIKSIIRKSSDLSIPKNKKFEIIAKDSNNNEILNKKIKISEFGSLSEKIKLEKTSPTWNYKIILKDDNWEYARWFFSVEVFKNPKFKNEVSLVTQWLNWEEVKIDKTIKDEKYYWRENNIWKFSIKANVSSKYYNWSVVKNANYTYKIYKQYYYDSSYWNDCYWGCYWEPKKEFYSEWKWTLDEDWKAKFSANVSFESSYDDYKYIVEVTVTDDNWDKITWSNSIIARLPDSYKRWNSNAWISFETKNKFYKKWGKFKISWWLSKWKWTPDYDNKYLFIIKKKNYKTKYIDDVRGYKRPINSIEEKIEKVLLVNSKNFNTTKDWKLELDFTAKQTWEYVFEYGKIDHPQPLLDKEGSLEKLIEKFNKEKKDTIKSPLLTKEGQGVVSLDEIINYKKYFTILSYWKSDAKNPIASDNKIRVLSEKISYNIWEKAKVLIRLPFSKWKILWTVEKQWVISQEYIDVNSNIFFKEIDVDDTFIPNAYIWVVAIDTENNKIPEYKVWYTEIVVDKSNKKSFIEIKTNKKTYKPREKVVLNISNKGKNWIWKKAELTVMVVDDSLISLMWNVDLNTLEKFYKKLPFQIQTSITNLAMLKNYYFSRPWIVGWSWFWNFKGWDSAVSTRTIFKNTAYFNPNIITDNSWNAKVEFNLPDNLTNFRIMVVSNSKDNFFWFGSKNIEVRKNVVIEDKTPLIYRAWDRTEISAKIFNNTNKEIWFKVKFESKDIVVNKWEKSVIIWANSSQIITFWTSWKIDKNKDLKYTLYALWDSKDNSDIIEKTIEYKEFPSLKSILLEWWIAELNKKQNFKIDIPENTDLEKSKVKISFSNNLLQWIDKLTKSLLVYPYWCIEQTMSSTYPNSVILNFSKLFPWIITEKEAIKNLEAWIKRVYSMQLSNGGFGYWQWDNDANLQITPYILRRLVDMKSFGAKVPDNMIEKASKYLENNFWNIKDNIGKTETFYAFAKIWKAELAYNKLLKWVDKSKLSRHELIAYTYWLITWDKEWNKDVIERNIDNIIKKLNDEKSQSRYWSKRSDKALFTAMLIDYWYSINTITKYIKELYSIDWSNYYYSTTAKNNAFIAFAKYMKKYWKNSLSKFAFSIWTIHNRDKRFYLWEENPNILTREFVLWDVVQYKEDYIELTTYVLSWWNIFTNLTMEIVPKNKFDIKTSSAWMNVKRQVFEVIDENKLEECSEIYSWNIKNNKVDCSKVLKKVENWEYKKWKKYKILINVNFDSTKERRNVALEDYIPSTFRIINSKFKTESSAIKNWTKKYWDWDHIEYLKDRVFANASRTRGDNLKFEYIVTPEFRWEFIYPPVNAYLMYDWDIRAHSEFEVIEVK